MNKKKSVKSYLSKESQAALKGNSIKLVHPSGNEGAKEKYSKTQFLEVYKGYDMLENLFTVRIFVQKRYNIDHYLFEILLKLMGLKVFSRLQYSKLPKPFNYKRLQNMMDTGLINQIMDHTDSEKRLYTLNTKGRNIVINFYKYLSGEIPIPEDSKFNTMAKKDSCPYDKKKMALIKLMNKTIVPDHIKTLY